MFFNLPYFKKHVSVDNECKCQILSLIWPVLALISKLANKINTDLVALHMHNVGRSVGRWAFLKII